MTAPTAHATKSRDRNTRMRSSRIWCPPRAPDAAALTHKGDERTRKNLVTRQAHIALWAQGMKATWRLDRGGSDRGGRVERLLVREKERIAELLAEGAPFWRLRQEVPRSRHAIRRAVMA